MKKKLYEYDTLIDQKIRLQAALKAITLQMEMVKQDRHEREKQIEIVAQKIADITPKEIMVTDKALLQYLEKAMKIDIEVVEKRIKNTLKGYAFPAANGRLPIGVDLVAIVHNNIIVGFE